MARKPAAGANRASTGASSPLGQAGTIKRIEVDTAHFRSNFPDRCSLQAGYAPGLSDQALVAQAQFWSTLLPEMKLQADHIHTFLGEVAALGAVTHIRLNLHPDGGVSRLRLWGEVASA